MRAGSQRRLLSSASSRALLQQSANFCTIPGNTIIGELAINILNCLGDSIASFLSALCP